MASATLPNGWISTTLGEIAQINPSGWDSPLDPETVVSFVPMMAVDAGSGRMDVSESRQAAAVSSGYTRFKNGDVLFAKITPCMENGKFAIAEDLQSSYGAGSTEFHILRPSLAIEPRFLLHFLLRRETRTEARRSMKGAAGQLRVPASFLIESPFSLPPLAEQRRIVAAIDEQFTRLDAAIASLQRARANLKRHRNAVLRTAECIEPDEHGAWTTRWPLAPIGKLGRVQLGRQRSPKNRSKDYPTKYIRAANITWQGLDLSDVLDMEFRPSELRIYRLEPGDILLGEASGSASEVGKPAIWRGEIEDCAFQNTVLRFRATDLDSRFAFVVLQSLARNGRFAEVARGVGIHHLGAERFAAVEIPVPPLEEQSRIVAEVERRLSAIEVMEAAVNANLKRADRLRQSILKRAFEGRLLPQDPTDEPAGQLLARIRAERARVTAPHRRGRSRVAVPRPLFE